MALFRPRGFIAFLTVAMLSACSDEKPEQGGRSSVAQLSPAQWHEVMRKRVYFGHQSVGENILAGVRSLAGEAGFDLPVVESAAPLEGYGIAHFRIGKNGDPLSKTADFATVMERCAGQGADVALMKLCYIDFNSGTDAKTVAGEYCAVLDRMARRHPRTKFIAVTVPLTVVQTGPKAWLKRAIGKTPAGFAENERRQEFNDVLRSVYGPRGEIFDVARIEAGGAPERDSNGSRPEALDPHLSSDGGHLNARGQRLLAASLLKLIAGISTTAR